MPEDHKLEPGASPERASSPEKELQDQIESGIAFDDFLERTGQALKGVDDSHAFQLPVYNTGTGDVHVPWHLEYFITDLAVSVQGLLAGLLAKGTPAFTLAWRRQNPLRQNHQFGVDLPPSTEAEPPKPEYAADFFVTEETKQDELNRQLEPAIQAAVASGRVKNEQALRKNLTTFAREFRFATRGLNNNPGVQWWVQRYRVDLTVDGSGHVMPMIAVGGNLRLRFEWHRIMRKNETNASAVGAGADGLPTPMQKFAYSMGEDLTTISDQTPVSKKGFQPYTFRVGIGVTGTLAIGIAKGSAALLGQVYFAQDLAAPKVRSKRLSTWSLDDDSITLIEDRPAQDRLADHLQYAARLNVPAKQSQNGTVEYKVNHERFRNGLMKASRMAAYFAAKAPRPAAGGWKIYELRTTFDLSIGGYMPLASVAGNATAEIDFYNTSF